MRGSEVRVLSAAPSKITTESVTSSLFFEAAIRARHRCRSHLGHTNASLADGASGVAWAFNSVWAVLSKGVAVGYPSRPMKLSRRVLHTPPVERGACRGEVSSLDLPGIPTFDPRWRCHAGHRQTAGSRRPARHRNCLFAQALSLTPEPEPATRATGQTPRCGLFGRRLRTRAAPPRNTVLRSGRLDIPRFGLENAST